MKDAKGHGSDTRGGAAHQTGVNAVPSLNGVPVPLSAIRVAQVGLNPDQVTRYQAMIRAGEELPAIEVARDPVPAERGGRQYVIQDGAHRYTATEREGRSTIQTRISQASARRY